MIVYFADRKMNILGKASTNLPKGFTIVNDKKIEDVDSGIATIEITVAFSKEQQTELQEMMNAGNYILRYEDTSNEFYTIIEARIDAKQREITVYAEDAGMDLLNEINGPFEATEAHNIEWYINQFAVDTGFEINVNEIPDLTRKLKWEGESTSAARIRSVATQFGAELSYSFEVEGLKVTHKYINIHIARGDDTDIRLELNKEIDNIVTTKTIANLCTGLEVVGGIPEGQTDPITLQGYSYDDGDIYISGTRLYSRTALAKWSRYVWEDEPNKIDGYSGHIVGSYSYETTSQQELCSHAVTALKNKSEMEVNYEVEISVAPEARIGDRVYIVDNNGELYLESRILRLERSITQETYVATLGEFLIKSSGISAELQAMAEQLKDIAGKGFAKKSDIPTKVSQLDNDSNYQTDGQVGITVNTAKVEAISTAAIDATNKADSAKTQAISTAASDATSKANAALNDSKTYTDGKYSSLRAEMVQADFLDAKAAKITDLVTENLQADSINGNVIKDGTVVAKALSNEAVTTLSGIKLYYSAEEPETSYAGGKNLFNVEIANQTWQSNLEVNGTTIGVKTLGRAYQDPWRFSDEPIDVTLSGSVRNISATNPRVALVVINADGSKTTKAQLYEGDTKVTAKANALRLDWSSGGTSSDVRFTIDKLQLERGTEATSYEPFAPADKDGHVMRDGDTWYKTVMTVDDLVKPLNVINDEVKDTFENGVITRRVGVVDLGTLNWTLTNTSGNPYFVSLDMRGLVQVSNLNALCSLYSIAGIANADPIGTCDKRLRFVGTGDLRIRDLSYSTVSEFKPAMQGVMLYYELATPYTEEGEFSNTVMSIWNNGEWAETPLDGSIIRANSITSQEIASNTITANNIEAGTITTREISSDYVYGGRIEAEQVFFGSKTAVERVEDAQNRADAYMQFDASSGLVIGDRRDGRFHGTTARLTSEQLGFFPANSDAPACYIGRESSDSAWSLYIEKGVIEDDLSFGQFQWITRTNGNMSLKWKG